MEQITAANSSRLCQGLNKSRNIDVDMLNKMADKIVEKCEQGVFSGENNVIALLVNLE